MISQVGCLYCNCACAVKFQDGGQQEGSQKGGEEKCDFEEFQRSIKNDRVSNTRIVFKGVHECITVTT